MGKAGLSPRLIPRSHAVPHLECRDRRLVILKKNYLQAVIKDRFIDLVLELGMRCALQGTQEKR